VVELQTETTFEEIDDEIESESGIISSGIGDKEMSYLSLSSAESRRSYNEEWDSTHAREVASIVDDFDLELFTLFSR